MRKFIVIALVFVGISTLIYTCTQYNDKRSKRNNWEHQLGTYKIDLTKTNLGSYTSEKMKYEKLEIVFKSDSTFRLNMDAPFIYDSSGTWITGGSSIDDWNVLYFKNKKVNVQFSQCCDSNDVFYLNSVTPKENKEPVHVIYFKKSK